MKDDDRPKVVPMRRKPPETPDSLPPIGCYAWTCWCGCAEFKLMADGSIVCWECDVSQDLRHFDPSEGGKPA